MVSADRLSGSASAAQLGGLGSKVNAKSIGVMAQILDIPPLELLERLNRATLDPASIRPEVAQRLLGAASTFADNIKRAQLDNPFVVFEAEGASQLVVIPRERLPQLAAVALNVAQTAAGQHSAKTADDFEFQHNVNLDDLMTSGPIRYGGPLADQQWDALQMLQERFDVLFKDGALAINPKFTLGATAFTLGGGPVVDDTKEGGRSLKPPPGASFGRAEFITVNPSAFALNLNQDPQLAERHLDLGRDQTAMLIELKSGREAEKFILLFGKDKEWGGNDAIATVCKAITVYPFDGGGPQVIAFKPVVYLYPSERVRARVSVDIGRGQFVSQYPRMTDGAWEVIATPTGALLDPRTDRQYPYLFWEARLSRPFFLEREKCFCVAREDAARFLEEVSDRFALNAQERTDFITYWLPWIEANPYTVIQFMDAQYESQARLMVSPEPDTVIRLYIVIAGSAEKIEMGMETASDLPQRERTGFTVVEWGGSNLDLHR